MTDRIGSTGAPVIRRADGTVLGNISSMTTTPYVGDGCALHAVWAGGVSLRYHCVLPRGHDGDHQWEPDA